jgi:hypothetical protein
MSGGSTVEEGRVGVVNYLGEDEALVLFAGSERCIRGLVARSQFGTLGDGMFVRSPHELDSVSDRCIDGEGVITEDTLSRSNNDRDGATGSNAA